MAPIIGLCVSALFFLFAIILVWNLYRRARELAPVMRKLQEVEAELIAKTKECDVLTANLEGMRSQKTEALRIIDDGTATKKWLEEHEPRMNELKAEEERLNSEVNRVTTNLTEKNTQLADINQKLVELGQQVEVAQEKRIEEGQKVLLAQSEYTRLEEQKRSLSADINSATGRIENLQTQISTLSRQKDELVAEVADLNQKKAERDALLNEIDRLKQSTETWQARQAEIESKVKELRSEEGVLTQEVERLGRQLPSEEKYWQELEMPIAVPNMARRLKANQTEAKWLDEFNETLSKYGFNFNKRTIKAFHTGLKCGEVTPLVVLAGISGTGKSLLPELYAAYAGFNFLSVPVQPRWDSPQDMLGFCNYMEGRYKATELARMLWQVRNDDGARNRDELSIVLLDEMNLARVEYYFSDLLSKLETRRGIDVANKDLREKASITLEGFQKGPRHLYVDTNVFFIGTMNEDETTQMLSDKVVDRSNLIRFGQPASLGVKPDKGSFMKMVGTQTRVGRKVWTSWEKKPNSDLDSWFDKIAEINTLFATIERPFAHRVDQAIRKYMIQYPYEQKEYRVAFADQLEMKILPKLNGVELAMPGFDQVKRKLSKIITELGDNELATAFNKATDESYNTFFKWRGVMR